MDTLKYIAIGPALRRLAVGTRLVLEVSLFSVTLDMVRSMPPGSARMLAFVVMVYCLGRIGRAIIRYY